MCSRDPPTLLPTLAKANGKNSSPQPAHHAEARIDSNLLPTPGGRLKFFKDGKFILELSHRRDGEKTTWFPVPKKTFWPPASTIPNRQESSTSLSGGSKECVCSCYVCTQRYGDARALYDSYPVTLVEPVIENFASIVTCKAR